MEPKAACEAAAAALQKATAKRISLPAPIQAALAAVAAAKPS
jgi:hypothetical protein